MVVRVWFAESFHSVDQTSEVRKDLGHALLAVALCFSECSVIPLRSCVGIVDPVLPVRSVYVVIRRLQSTRAFRVAISLLSWFSTEAHSFYVSLWMYIKPLSGSQLFGMQCLYPVYFSLILRGAAATSATQFVYVIGALPN